MQRALAFIAALIPALSVGAICNSSREILDEVVGRSPGIQSVVFVARDLRDGSCWQAGASDVNTRHPPWSTFKFPHFLIALETGAVASASEVIRWDASRRPPESYWPDVWKADHNLGTAFTYSAAWPFQELVPKIGSAHYKQWLTRFKYGNTNVPLGRDDFWLGGPLAISPMEQVAFLSCIAVSGCGVSSHSIRALEAVAKQAEFSGKTMYAKTGSGPIKPRDFSGHFEGWYVGYIRDAQGTALVAFSTYVRSDSYDALRTYRQSVSLKLLGHLGLWQK